MKFLILFSLLVLELFFFVNAKPNVVNLFIEENGAKCALLDFSADITVTYDSLKGRQSVVLYFDNSTASGGCSQSPTETDVTFKIKISSLESLVLYFKNMSNSVVLTSVEFNYTTPNDKIPFAKHNGTVSGIATPNMALSKANSYYECNSELIFNMTNGIILNMYYAKIQVFNVTNNEFSNEQDECPQDFATTHESSTAHTTHSFTSKSTITTNRMTTHFTTISTKGYNTTTNPHTQSTTTKRIETTSSARITSHLPTGHSTNSPSSTTMSPSKNLHFTIRNKKSNNICLIFDSTMNVIVTYSKENGKASSQFDIESNATIDGECQPAVNMISIGWVSGLTLNFTFTDSNNQVALNNISVSYKLTSNFFPGNNETDKVITSHVSINNVSVSNGDYYSCNTNTFNVDSTSIKLTNFRYQAFLNSPTDNWSGKEMRCDLKNPLVAIIVGAVLAVFLLIVVVIFFIFRYKARRRRDYEEI